MKESEIIEMFQQQAAKNRDALAIMSLQIQILNCTLEEVLKLCIETKCHHNKNLKPDELRNQIGQSIKAALDKILPSNRESDLN